MKKVAFLGIILFAVMISIKVQGAVLYVSGTGGCGGSTPCYSTIQAAVDAANDGDEVRVAKGTYSGTAAKDIEGKTYTQVVAITKTLTLTGGYSSTEWTTSDPTANPTIIDAQAMGRGISIVGSGSQAVTVAGFTITNGDYTGLGNPPGVANFVCQGTGTDCGGGLFAYQVKLILRDCLITNNVASRTKNYSDGGGAYLWSLMEDSLIENTSFIGNKSIALGGVGGGMNISHGKNLNILKSLFQQNQSGEPGGGLFIFQPRGQILIEDTDFIENVAGVNGPNPGLGGAFEARLTVEGNALCINRVEMKQNQAEGTGAAVSLIKQGSGESRVEIINTLLAENSTWIPETDVTLPYPHASVFNVNGGSGGDFILNLSHLTIADNGVPVALRLETHLGAPVRATVTNTLIQDATHAYVGREVNGEVSIQHTNTLTWNVTNLHTIESGSPTFNSINPITGDPKLDSTYHLQMGSAAIDAGVDAGVTTDIDADPRPTGSAPDIGADEFSPIKPHEGTIGTTLTIYGPGFGAKKGKVVIGGAALKILAWMDNSIQGQLTKALSPDHYDVTVQPPGKGVSPIIFEDGFTVKAPEIDSVEPTSGSIRDSITINGYFFGNKKGKVTLGGKSCKVLSWTMVATTGESEARFVIPKGLSPGNNELKVTNGVGSDTSTFTVE